jgi:hypothetical protein
MTKKLEGKTAVITGGTEGIGFATARLFVKEVLVLPEEIQGNVIDLEGRKLVAVEVGHTNHRQHDVSSRAISRVSRRWRRGLQRCSPLPRRVKRAKSPRVDHCIFKGMMHSLYSCPCTNRRQVSRSPSTFPETIVPPDLSPPVKSAIYKTFL